MIRIATIGTSSITESFLDALAQEPRASFCGTLSRNPERAAAFTRAHGGTTPFSSLSALAADGAVDAVYIASPNALHASQARELIRAGKHVLVEKPFAATEREARAVFAEAEAAGVVALEAMRPVHDPAFLACRDALPELGPLRTATLRFGKYSSRYDELRAGRHTNIFDAALASGALMDMGVYPVEALVALFGMPERIVFAPVMLDAATRPLTHGPLDGAGVLLASYPAFVATACYSKISNDRCPSQIEGEAGTLTIEGISCPSAARIAQRIPAAGADSAGYSAGTAATHDLALPTCPNSMVYELADFLGAIDAVRGGTAPAAAPAGGLGSVGAYRDLTLNTLNLLDEARRQAGIAFPADEA